MEEKIRLFNIYKRDSTEFEVPRDQVAKDFALDLIIYALSSTFK